MSKSILYKGLKVADVLSPLNGQIVDVLYHQQKATVIPHNTNIVQVEQEINGQDLVLTRPFTDLRFSLPDPGFEYREDFDSAAKLAAKSGFARLCCMPDTFPIMQSKSAIRYVIKNSELFDIDFLPVGALSKDFHGKELTEMFDMHSEGAVAFCDVDFPTHNASFLMRALHYNLNFNGLVFSLPQDVNLTENTMMHEGQAAMNLGLKGAPSLAEYIIVKRDLDILKYTGGKLHFAKLSCAESVDLIRKAKSEGLNVTADAAFLNILFNEDALLQFDTNFKVFPPLRSENDRLALIHGLLDGTIDAICSDHKPLNEEQKEVEFLYADNGVSTLQALWPALLDLFISEVGVDKIASMLSYGPEKVLNIIPKPIDLGSISEFVITGSSSWTLLPNSNASLSKNSPFMNKTFNHQIIAFMAKGNLSTF